MRYVELTLENFRLFRGEQSLRFPPGTGVLIVYGLNGKGKTTLLNAIRWAWTGTARHRGNRAIPNERLINREAQEQSDGGSVTCRVRLQFETDGANWDLTRILRSEHGFITSDLTLLKDGVALTASDATRQLEEFMPPAIEQFFLFDGELLDQYEKLVDDDAAAGSQLRDAIERILGVPVVINSERDMRAMAEEAGKEIAEAAKHGARTRELGVALGQAQVRMTKHRENRDAEDARITELEGQRRDIEEQLAEHENKLDLLARRNVKRNDLAALKKFREDALADFSAAFATSWRGVLVEPVTAAVAKLEAELEGDRELLTDSTVAVALGTAFRANGERVCPACDSDLDDVHRAHLHQFIGADSEHELEQLGEKVQNAAERIKILRRMIDQEARAGLKASEEAYRRCDVEVGDAEDELSQLDEQLKDTPTDELGDLVTRRAQVDMLLQKAQDTYRDEEQKYLDLTARVDRLRKQIQATGGGDADPGTTAREALTRDMAILFERAIVAYRDKLKENVQEKASQLFRSMRTETDFLKLVINDQYGLRILDTHGRAVEDRSAGYEHLVALSLVGALQECSPISGPIVMDSPFGRLDPRHVRGVVGQLNVLSDQVVLLVHEGEIDRASAHEQLRSRLLVEYELQRVSAYNTRIEELTTS